MENASKAIIMAGQALIFVIALSIGINFYVNFQSAVKSVLSDSEKISMNSEYLTGIENFEHYAKECEVINSILCLKKDVLKSYNYDTSALEFSNSAYLPDEIQVEGKIFSRDNSGLHSSYSSYDPECDVANKIAPGYYGISYNYDVNNSTGKINKLTLIYTYKGATLEEAQNH